MEGRGGGGGVAREGGGVGREGEGLWRWGARGGGRGANGRKTTSRRGRIPYCNTLAR